MLRPKPPIATGNIGITDQRNEIANATNVTFPTVHVAEQLPTPSVITQKSKTSEKGKSLGIQTFKGLKLKVSFD